MNKTTSQQVTICCGGGIDSTALIHYYLQRGFQVRGVHFDYGQPSYAGERKAISKVAQHFGIHIATVKIEPAITHQIQEEIIGRNALLILLAVNYFQQSEGLIALGIHTGTGYYDCTPQFTEQMQTVLDGYLEGKIQLDCPFVNFTKRDVMTYCKTWNIPVDVTYSCTNASDEACGYCPSCLDRQMYDFS